MTCRDSCTNRGKINGRSQETFCSMCVRGDSWKKDYYEGPQIDTDIDEINRLRAALTAIKRAESKGQAMRIAIQALGNKK